MNSPIKPSSSLKIDNFAALEGIKNSYLKSQGEFEKEILVCGGAGCISSNCLATRDAITTALEENGLSGKVRLTVTGCMGICAVGPVILVQPGGTFYIEVDSARAEDIIKRHIIGGEIIPEYTFYDSSQKKHVPCIDDISFFKEQVRIALRNCGQMDYSSLEAYISRDGYAAFYKALNNLGRAGVVEEVKEAGLRGRGGAGFPTGIKLQAGMNAPGDIKYMVCNADEGDPGAFMDRSIIEGDPHTVIEGMLIAGYAIGASQGYVYVRAEYPLAIERLQAAIEQAREAGLLGNNIFGSEFSFDIEIRIGAGAFVCGEETSLISSIEGKRGEPRQKPPFPFESGLFDRPTIINNVETLANLAPIIFNGSTWFQNFGTEKSRGTKVFALAGNIVNAGIIEVPMGIRLGDIIFKIGGGIIGGKKFKAALSGGPSGGCLTVKHLNVAVDYESLSELGAIMGSGGLIVMNEDTCMVDTARFFLDFTKDESCGKCLPCRNGTKKMLEILERLTEGKGMEGDIETLSELAEVITKTAMCGLGQTAANPVASTIQYFRDEYENHIHAKHCKAGVCAEMYTSPCQNACPAQVNVPGYMALVATNRLAEAYELIRQDNPFPAVCGRVCTHPCEYHCRRAQVDESLAICSVKRFVGDFALRDDYSIPAIKQHPSTGKRVSVIGSGPSGLTCAYYLATLGHEVVVYEAEDKPGGVLLWGIPEYRLPEKALNKEINAIVAAGVDIRVNTKVGKDISFDQVRKGSDAVYIAIGTQVSRSLGIPGEDLPQVVSGLSYLKNVGLKREVDKPERMVVIGGGSTAMDVARTALRLGSKEVVVAYRRTIDNMPASSEEVEEAIEEGVKIIELVSPIEVVSEDGRVTGLKCARMREGDFSDDGRRRTYRIPDSEFVIPCDGIAYSINQEIDKTFFDAPEGVDKHITSLDTNRFTHQTEQKGVFAGGDISPWAENLVITAIADGKRAAVNIDKYLGGAGVLNKGEEINIPVIDNEETAEHPRFPIKHRPASERIKNFSEASCGFHKLDAMGESLRCLHCDRR